MQSCGSVTRLWRFIMKLRYEYLRLFIVNMLLKIKSLYVWNGDGNFASWIIMRETLEEILIKKIINWYS